MKLRYLWPALAWSIFILVITLMPGEELPEVDIIEIDKVVHLFIFGVLMFLASLGLQRSFEKNKFTANPVAWAFIYSLVLGIIVEILQLFVPLRSFSVIDIIANTLGCTIGYLIYRYAQKKN